MPAITNVTELQAMNLDLAGTYWLANNIDAAATIGWNGGAGFIPVGDNATPFTGTFNSAGYTISDLFINRPGTDYVGLFGATNGATIQSAELTGLNITGKNHVGGLIGKATNTTINLASTSGAVSGQNWVGGLCGSTYTNTVINNPHSAAVVIATFDCAGGLIGSCNNSTVTEPYATGTVFAGDDCAGGLFGYCDDSTITKFYAMGDVDAGDDYAGGVIGYCENSILRKFYATGDVSGDDYVGGAIGYAYDNDISDAYSLGAVDGDVFVGGFVGQFRSSIAALMNAYSIGAVTGNTSVGGFCGKNYNTITACFWDTQTSGQATSDGGIGKTTVQMKIKSTFIAAGWDFIIIWAIHWATNNGYPFFWAMPPGGEEALPDSPRETVAVEDKITLESIRNIEMAARGRAFIDEEGNFVYKSRYARNP